MDYLKALRSRGDGPMTLSTLLLCAVLTSIRYRYPWRKHDGLVMPTVSKDAHRNDTRVSKDCVNFGADRRTTDDAALELEPQSQALPIRLLLAMNKPSIFSRYFTGYLTASHLEWTDVLVITVRPTLFRVPSFSLTRQVIENQPELFHGELKPYQL